LGGEKHVLIAAITLIKFVTVCSQRACQRNLFLPSLYIPILSMDGEYRYKKAKEITGEASTRLLVCYFTLTKRHCAREQQHVFPPLGGFQAVPD
jgi:dihydroorotase